MESTTDKLIRERDLALKAYRISKRNHKACVLAYDELEDFNDELLEFSQCPRCQDQSAEIERLKKELGDLRMENLQLWGQKIENEG